MCTVLKRSTSGVIKLRISMGRGTSVRLAQYALNMPSLRGNATQTVGLLEML
jgi:hypothetical protein